MTSSQRELSPAVLLAALGVVYGDIGTSPLYALKESLTGEHGAGVTPDDVYGVLSMIFWAITLVVSIKYVLLVLRARFGFSGASLTNSAVGANCTRCDSTAILAYLNGLGLTLDIDNIGELLERLDDLDARDRR